MFDLGASVVLQLKVYGATGPKIVCGITLYFIIHIHPTQLMSRSTLSTRVILSAL